MFYYNYDKHNENVLLLIKILQQYNDNAKTN